MGNSGAKANGMEQAPLRLEEALRGFIAELVNWRDADMISWYAEDNR